MRTTLTNVRGRFARTMALVWMALKVTPANVSQVLSATNASTTSVVKRTRMLTVKMVVPVMVKDTACVHQPILGKSVRSTSAVGIS